MSVGSGQGQAARIVGTGSTSAGSTITGTRSRLPGSPAHSRFFREDAGNERQQGRQALGVWV